MKDSEKRLAGVLKQMLGGGGYVSFPELLMGVTRGGCCREFPPLQYMMQALPPSGCLRPLLMATSLAEVGGIAENFARLTGFRRVYVNYLTDSFAFALGLLAVEPAIPPLEDEPTEAPMANSSDGSADDANGSMAAEQQGEYGTEKKTGDKDGDDQQPPLPQWNNSWSMEEKTRFLTGLITVNRDNERRLGVRVVNPVCTFAGDYNFKLSAELRRDEADATAGLFYAVYSREGTVLETSLLGSLCYDDVSPMPRMATAQITPALVGKILIYWD
jgi:hypothetical protein